MMDNSQELLALYGLQKAVKAKLSDLENRPQTCGRVTCRLRSARRVAGFPETTLPRESGRAEGL